MRLWQRIHDKGLFAFTEEGTPPDTAFLQEEIITRAVLVDLQNVSDYIRSQFRNGRSPRIAPSEVDTFAQPFPVTWYEWHYVNADYGALVLQAPNEDDSERWIGLYLFTYQREFIDGLLQRHDPRAVCLGLENFVVDSDTYGLASGTQWAREMYFDGLHPTAMNAASEIWRETMDNAAALFMFAMKFLHCRNVVMVDAADHRTRQQRRHDERRGIAPITFKSLVINPSLFRGQSAEERTADMVSPKALHIVRGNFAHYTDDKPLFGKYTGTFWRPAHVRGTADAGTVYKDYRVKAGVS